MQQIHHDSAFAHLKSMNFNAIYMMQQERNNDAISVLVQTLSFLSDYSDREEMLEETNFEHSAVSLDYIVSVSLAQPSLGSQNPNASSSDAPSMHFFDRPFCMINDSYSGFDGQSTSMTNTFIMLFNTGLAFQRLGLQCGRSIYLSRALMMYEKMIIAISSCALRHHNVAKLMLMAAYLNQTRIFSEYFFNHQEAKRTQTRLYQIMSVASFDTMSIEELAVFTSEKTLTTSCKLSGAAAA